MPKHGSDISWPSDDSDFPLGRRRSTGSIVSDQSVHSTAAGRALLEGSDMFLPTLKPCSWSNDSDSSGTSFYSIGSKRPSPRTPPSTPFDEQAHDRATGSTPPLSDSAPGVEVSPALWRRSLHSSSPSPSPLTTPLPELPTLPLSTQQSNSSSTSARRSLSTTMEPTLIYILLSQSHGMGTISQIHGVYNDFARANAALRKVVRSVLPKKQDVKTFIRQTEPVQMAGRGSWGYRFWGWRGADGCGEVSIWVAREIVDEGLSGKVGR